MFDILDAIFRLMAGQYSYGMFFTLAICLIFIISIFIGIKNKGLKNELNILKYWFII